MRTPAKIFVGIIAVAFFLTVASSARADSFNWNFSSTSVTAVTASGTFTTGAFSGGQATITGITGTVNGTAIASLLAPGSYLGNDNILTYPGTPYLDSSGVSFSLTGNINVNMYNISGLYFVQSASILGHNSSLTVSPVPEPSTIFLLAVGLLGLAALQWRRKAGSANLRV